ncbi:hypothetical protein DRP07_00135 [Archaeoglobales archaeon]|nr:MAG: hypothetical protein DRP07_00135 [Archaeoglobales archaeon]
MDFNEFYTIGPDGKRVKAKRMRFKQKPAELVVEVEDGTKIIMSVGAAEVVRLSTLNDKGEPLYSVTF